MRVLVCALVLAAAAIRAPAQTPGQPAQSVRGDERQCPDVRVTYNGDAPLVGVPLKFSAAVSATTNAAALTYQWQVSAGAIASGQGGPEMEVDTQGVASGTVTATVTVGGLPPGCTNTASHDLVLYLCLLPPPPAPAPTVEPSEAEFTDRRPGRRRAKQGRARRSPRSE